MDTNNMNNSTLTCKACGNTIKPGAKFCVICGCKVEQTETPSTDAYYVLPVDETPAATFSPAEEETKPAAETTVETPVIDDPVPFAFASENEAPAAESPFTSATESASADETPVFTPAAPADEAPVFTSATPADEAPVFTPAAPADEAPMFTPAAPADEAPMFTPAAPVDEAPVFTPATPADTASAFTPADETPKKNDNESQAFSSVDSSAEVKKTAPKSTYVEPENIFAKGLPEWSIEPPMTAVRRRH